MKRIDVHVIRRIEECSYPLLHILKWRAISSFALSPLWNNKKKVVCVYADVALPKIQNIHVIWDFLPPFGKSQGSPQTFQQPWEADGRRVPVFGVTFGEDADRSQLETLAKLTGGRVFDGTTSLTDAFRAVRGYN